MPICCDVLGRHDIRNVAWKLGNVLRRKIEVSLHECGRRMREPVGKRNALIGVGFKDRQEYQVCIADILT